jgi:predicted dehydrogenase
MTLNIGFIGVGGIARKHLINLSNIEEANVQSVFDVDADRAAKVGKEFGANFYSDLTDMLDGEKLDAVYVCVPPFAHGEAEMAIVERGIPMFVEKPISIEHDPAENILQEVNKKNVLTSVGYHWRYSDATAIAKNGLVHRTPGLVQGFTFLAMPPAPWWRKQDKSGGQMLEQTTHIVDLARYLIGEITEVYAVYAHRQLHEIAEGVTVPDVGSVTLKFANGTVGTISNTCLLDHNFTVGLDILTRDTAFEVRERLINTRSKGESATRHNISDAYLEEDKAFIKAIKTGDRSLIRSTYEDAFKTHQVTVAANESAEKGSPIHLPFVRTSLVK